MLEQTEDIKRRKRILIVFPYPILAYSPTTINLYDALDADFEVTILAPSPPPVWRRLGSRRVEYVKTPDWAGRLAESINYRLKRYIGWHTDLGRWLSAWLLLRAARRHDCAEAIGVDFMGVWVVQRAFGRGHMVSLEIEDDDPFRRHVEVRRLNSLIIQTQERHDYLFRDTGLNCFLVQNAPVHRPASQVVVPERPRTDLVYCGTAVRGFGIYRCLDFLKAYPEYRLTIQGTVYPKDRETMERDYSSLFAAGRIAINETYLEGEELLHFLSRFAIGFCCYDLSAPGMNRFNYVSAPSGKLFTYYAAGVPVVGSDLPGLASVREFEAGVLIPEFTPDAIKQAIDIIIPDCARMKANCLRAAEHFSFDKAIAPFVRFLAAGRVVAPHDADRPRERRTHRVHGRL